MENALDETRSATAIFDDGPKAERAIAWLLNIGLRQGQIRQTAEPVSGQVRPVKAEAAPPPKRRRSLVSSLVDFVLPDDRSGNLARRLPGNGPRRVTVSDIAAARYDTVARILSDEGTLVADTPKIEAPKIDLKGASGIRGLIGAYLVDCGSGRLLATEGTGDIDPDLVAMLNTEFLSTWQEAADELALDDPLDEIVLTLGRQIHLLRPLERKRSILLYVALDKGTCNVGMARIQLDNIEADLAI